MIIIGWIVALILIALAAVLRAGGASLVRTPRADALRDAAEPAAAGADKVARLLEDRSEIQPALGTTITALIVLAVIPLTWAITDSLNGAALGVALVAMTVGLLLLVDVIPRWVGRNRPRSLAYRLASPLSVAIAIGSAAGDLIADPDEDDPVEDPSDAEERELIMSVLEFTDTIVREVMVPRTDMVTLAEVASTDDAVDLVLESGRSRIPVTGESVDHVVGVVFGRDLLELFDREAQASSVRRIMHEAYFVPETKPISELLREMQAKQQHMAIVIDEFGGTAGLVTIEDLIEELVGEIVDEYDEEEPMVVEADGAWLVDARLDVDDLAELVGIELPSDEWDTVGGLVLELAGRVPEQGEAFDHDGLVFTAHSVQGRRVAKVRVTRR
jgi:CBS domain containing-hemolysin-like protein